MAEVNNVQFVEILPTYFIPIKSIFKIEFSPNLNQTTVFCDTETFFIEGLSNSIIFLRNYFKFVSVAELFSFLSNEKTDPSSDVKNFKTTRG